MSKKKVISDEVYQAMLVGFDKFTDQFSNWAHDERDGGANPLKDYIEKALGRTLSKEELNSRLFKKADKQSDAISAEACDIGYQYRIGGRQGGMQAELAFEKVMKKYPNF